MLQVLPASAVIEDSYSNEITLIQNTTAHQCTHILSKTHSVLVMSCLEDTGTSGQRHLRVRKDYPSYRTVSI